MVPPQGGSPTLTLEAARSALKECADLMDAPDVVAQITAVKASAGQDHMMAMMLVRHTPHPRRAGRVRTLCCVT